MESEKSGALASANKVLGQFVRRSGFLDFTASIQANFMTYLNYQPAHGGMNDIESGALKKLILFLKSRLAPGAARALQAQAHVRPEAAVKLLK